MPSLQDFSAEIVERARDGDEKAREHLLTCLQPVLRAYFVKRVGYRSEIDDLVQNTLLRVHNGLKDLLQPSKFKAFAMKAALFELQDLYRGRYRGKELLYDPDQPPGATDRQDSTPLRIDLEKALEHLTPKARRILELKESGYRYEEIAEKLGTTEAAVKMQVKRSFERLRDILAAVVVFFLLSGVTFL